MFKKGEVYQASSLKNDICDVYGDRLKRNGSTWTGVLSLGAIVVLGVASFEILEDEDGPDVDENHTEDAVSGVELEGTEQA